MTCNCPCYCGNSNTRPHVKPTETPQEKRQRAKEIHTALMQLVDKYGVKLSRNFSSDDDPDELQKEYNAQKEKIDRNNNIKFYKQLLLNGTCFVEFMNEKYDPFDFKLKDFSKELASNLDNYTEVMGKLYDKYKNAKSVELSPEAQLGIKVVIDGVTYHLSQVLFPKTTTNLNIPSKYFY
ncbi:hypothetical protein QJ856_gp0104 [Tupanvirus deep ocean]|uniref:Uncharacterized protein n=2 Tax=Tupanvirus TaxID=2094720 RepID=A0AC62AAB9_9VIRU|nr:hypothetical protein QJ856_gp0104 [Tupanvirus deep ocean]QKU34623.1 hypothetical protein [Tupanvirus deep ocean]